MASSDHGAQKPIRVRGSSKCPHHRGKEVVYVCENCRELACVRCVTNVHIGHRLTELGDVTASTKTKLQDFIDTAQNHEIPKIKGKMQDVDKEITQKKQNYQEDINRIEKQNEILIEELNNITRKLVKSYRDMETQDIEILQNNKTELQAQVDDRSLRIQECEDTLLSGNDVQIYDVSSDLPSEFKDIPTPTLPALSFTPGQFTLLQLEKLIGEVTKRGTVVDLNQQHQVVNYSVESEFTPYSGHLVKSLHAPPANKIWVCLASICNKSPVNSMLLVHYKGEVQQTLDMEVGVVDFYLSRETGILWFCSLGESTVRSREAKGSCEGSVVRFQTNKIPRCICLTADDLIVVGHIHEVVKYTKTGEVIHNTPGGFKPLVIYPWHISKCPNTGRLAVVDLDDPEYGGSGQPSVSILDERLNLLYKYFGDTPGGHPLTEPFNPYDVCYTANGSLIVTDYDNRSVLLVDEKGEYLQTLYYRSDSKPASVFVHNKRFIWVSFSDGTYNY